MLRIAQLCVALIAMCLAPMALSTEKKTPDHWLRNAADDEHRFELLEGYLGGFSTAMREVGERYRSVYRAIQDGNPELARYHWGKIASAIRNGYLKRPGRQGNADKLFLESAWPLLDKALHEGNEAHMRNAFAQARSACMTCHEAEKVPFMNRQPLFRELVFD